MRIAVDLDDTLSVVDRVTRSSGYIARMKLPFRLVDENAHELVNVFDWQLKDVLQFVREGGITIFTDAEARKGARETLAALRAEGHEIIVLTARSKEWFVNPEKVSRDWLEKRRIPYDALVAEVKDKGEYCKAHGISALVDDSFETCLIAQELGISAVLMVDKHNVSRALEIHYSGANWRQIEHALRRIAGRTQA